MLKRMGRTEPSQKTKWHTPACALPKRSGNTSSPSGTGVSTVQRLMFQSGPQSRPLVVTGVIRCPIADHVDRLLRRAHRGQVQNIHSALGSAIRVPGIWRGVPDCAGRGKNISDDARSTGRDAPRVAGGPWSIAGGEKSTGRGAGSSADGAFPSKPRAIGSNFRAFCSERRAIGSVAAACHSRPFHWLRIVAPEAGIERHGIGIVATLAKSVGCPRIPPRAWRAWLPRDQCGAT